MDSLDSSSEEESSEGEKTEFVSQTRLDIDMTQSILGSSPFVFIVLDCFYYIAGEKITGEVLLYLPESCPSGQLIFMSNGIEEVYLYNDDNKEKPVEEDCNVIFDLREVIKEWRMMIPAGQYVFPFAFKPPRYAPSTYYFAGNLSADKYIKAEISYKITAKLVVNAHPEKSLQHSRNMVLRNKNTRTKPNPVMEITHIVNGCCCTNKGATHFKLSVLGDCHCQSDGKIKYNLTPDNSKCLAKITRVIGHVVLDQEFTIKSRVYNIRKDLSSVTSWINVENGDILDKDFEHVAEISLHEEVNTSSNYSVLVKCTHFIEVLVFYELTCNKKPIRIRLPVHVDPKDSVFKREDPVLPRPWEPDEAPIINFMINESRQSSSYCETVADVNSSPY